MESSFSLGFGIKTKAHLTGLCQPRPILQSLGSHDSVAVLGVREIRFSLFLSTAIGEGEFGEPPEIRKTSVPILWRREVPRLGLGWISFPGNPDF